MSSKYKPFSVKAKVLLGLAIGAQLVLPFTAVAAPSKDLFSADLKHKRYFNRISTFPVFKNTNIDTETVAEIVAASEDGKVSVYTDAETESVGFVDIANPNQPAPLGAVALDGEPTSVAVVGRFALVAVNTSPSFVSPSGELIVIDMTSKNIVGEFQLNGQPDAVAISPNKKYAAIAIENERDEDFNDCALPQAPAGFLAIVDLAPSVEDWQIRDVDLQGFSDLYPYDPEPEYVDINAFNVAAVTLQENNHIVLVYLPTGKVIKQFSAGNVDLSNVDTVENDLIEPNSDLAAVLREPDGIAWTSPFSFATANEGDLAGGSRGFTIFGARGNVLYESNSGMEHIITGMGHYPEGRSENKGNEPENVAFARYRNNNFLFVGSERSGLVLVYRMGPISQKPRFIQALPTGVKPEGILPIPQRNLLVVASEEDARDDKIRSSLSIYQLQKTGPDYPTVVAKNKKKGAPRPWGALSGLALDKANFNTAYSVHDSFYRKSRIYKIKLNKKPVRIIDEIILNDQLGQLASVDASLVDAEGNVNLDLEGISTTREGEFWLVSEGSGTVGSGSRPFESLNLLISADQNGTITQVITLPASVNARQIRFGLEGVTSVIEDGEETVYVAFQREWQDDVENHVRIGAYNVADEQWKFYYYPIETPLSANGGWVGLSEIDYLGNQQFAVIERDNQGGADAALKRIYKFSIAGLSPMEDPESGTPSFPVVSKTLVRDLMPVLGESGGMVLEKIEGLLVKPNGDALIVNDNDGVDDSNGETQLIKLKRLFN